MLKDRFKPNPDDFVIVIMGPTGSGKTNFINRLTRNVEQRKASSLKCNTQNVTPYPIMHRDLRVVLVDTPSFDDTYRPDSEILRVIADWLVQKYSNGIPLRIAGIIYVHRITDNRVPGSAYKNLQMFGRLCGNAPLPRTRLVTTMWDQSNDQATAIRRETQLIDEFWRTLVDGGATVHRFYHTPDSAQKIVGSLLRMGNGGEQLLIQEELIEQQKRINETEAGKITHNWLQKLQADKSQMLKELTEQAKQQNDPDLARCLQDQRDKVDVQLQETFEETKTKIPLARRILLWLFGRKFHTERPTPTSRHDRWTRSNTDLARHPTASGSRLTI